MERSAPNVSEGETTVSAPGSVGAPRIRPTGRHSRRRRPQGPPRSNPRAAIDRTAAEHEPRRPPCRQVSQSTCRETRQLPEAKLPPRFRRSPSQAFMIRTRSSTPGHSKSRGWNRTSFSTAFTRRSPDGLSSAAYSLQGLQKITLKAATDWTRQEAVFAMDAVMAQNQVAMIPIGDKFVKAVPMSIAGTEGAEPSNVEPGIMRRPNRSSRRWLY